MPPCACSAPSSSTACRVEFSDPRDGRFKLMEINPRLWLWHGLAAALGVDFARIAYLDLLDRRGAPLSTEGKRSLGDHPPCGRGPVLQRHRTWSPCSPSTIRSRGPQLARDSVDSARSGTARTVGARHPRRPRCRLRRRAIRRVRGEEVERRERPEGDAFFTWRGSSGGRCGEHGRFPVSATSTRSNRRSRRLRTKLEPLRWGGARFAVALSHDVDTPWRWTRKGLRVGRLKAALRERRGSTAWREARGLATAPVHRLRGTDPNFSFERIVDLERRRGAASFS